MKYVQNCSVEDTEAVAKQMYQSRVGIGELLQKHVCEGKSYGEKVQGKETDRHEQIGMKFHDWGQEMAQCDRERGNIEKKQHEEKNEIIIFCYIIKYKRL